MIPSGFEPLRFDADLDRFFLPKEIESQMA